MASGNLPSTAAGARNARQLAGSASAAPAMNRAKLQAAAPTAIVLIKLREVEELRRSQRRLREVVEGYIAAQEVKSSCERLRDATQDGLRQLRSGGSLSDATLDQLSSLLRVLKDHSSARPLHALGRVFEHPVADMVRAVNDTSDSIEPLAWDAAPDYRTALSDGVRAVGIAHDRAAEIARLCREHAAGLMESTALSLDRIFDRKTEKSDAARAEQARAEFAEAGSSASTTLGQSASRRRLQETWTVRSGLTSQSPTRLQTEYPVGGSVMPDDGDRAAPARRIRVLFLAANPMDTGRLRLDEEVRSIDQALREADFRNNFEVEVQLAVRSADLARALLRFKPDIVHFSGHGTTSSEIVLEGPQGAGRAVPRDALGQLFFALRDNIRCVVLNACYSVEQAEAIAQHIDCVVGMTQAVGDDAAIRFAGAFYRALGYGKSIETAFRLGTIEVGLEGLPDADTPQLVAERVNPAEVVLVAPTAGGSVLDSTPHP